MSQIDWSRATVKVRAPVVHTAMEDVQEIEVSLAALIRLARETEVEGLCESLGHMPLTALGDRCARCGRSTDE